MEFKDNQAIYLQIANHFFENILQRKWQRGEKIPSIRDMAVQFEVNPNTTMRTYNYLQEKGIIYNKRGLGYYLADDGLERALEIKKEQFINKDLPELFRTMQLLEMSIDDLKKYLK
ncbi:MAG TPA: GntR family transcriptional regulator [Cytophagaceae bacterium]|jgi:DNA-binding transcriptional regulator YhcF (GntR family)